MSEFLDQASQTVKKITILVEFEDHDQTEVLIVENPEKVESTTQILIEDGKIPFLNISIESSNPEAVYKRVMV